MPVRLLLNLSPLPKAKALRLPPGVGDSAFQSLVGRLVHKKVKELFLAPEGPMSCSDDIARRRPAEPLAAGEEGRLALPSSVFCSGQASWVVRLHRGPAAGRAAPPCLLPDHGPLAFTYKLFIFLCPLHKPLVPRSQHMSYCSSWGPVTR